MGHKFKSGGTLVVGTFYYWYNGTVVHLCYIVSILTVHLMVQLPASLAEFATRRVGL